MLRICTYLYRSGFSTWQLVAGLKSQSSPSSEWWFLYAFPTWRYAVVGISSDIFAFEKLRCRFLLTNYERYDLLLWMETSYGVIAWHQAKCWFMMQDHWFFCPQKSPEINELLRRKYSSVFYNMVLCTGRASCLIDSW